MKQQFPTTLDKTNIPEHVAIIMDGNGRWAQKRLLPRTAGHKKGVDAVEEVLEGASVLGIKVLTLYAFSTENWKRPEEEVSFIFKLPKLFYNRLLDKLQKWNVRIKWIGELEMLPDTMQALIQDFEEQTKDNTGLLMYLAFNYGSQAEITSTVKKIATQVENGAITVDDITTDYISSQLYTGGDSTVELLIRTSGELRMSNFLLWQSAYSEFYFTDKLWPDFTKEDLYTAVEVYQSRNRRKGGI